MPFFRAHSKRSKLHERRSKTSTVASRPGTADSFFVPPRPPPPPPAFLPDRSDNVTRASFAYDNGTGTLDAQLVRADGLPMHFKTTDQLAEFIRNRSSSSVSSSHYSTESTCYSPARPEAHRVFSVQSNPYTLPRPDSHTVRAVSNPMIAGISRRYVSAPVVRVLPGATKKNEHQGYWMRKGTMRRLPVEGGKDSKVWWKKAKGDAEEERKYVETSGWYDD
ncbi:hypothetical protein PV11_04259 [Exophiala sideris]|uniref:Uncharacterized protein n=1 Tax=Exophiala sideris TaxID=1016849 RepID=A0A0D1W093_9EURO|nr:hypothetical protein PV11_04259 [Exophiala sideris]